MIEPPQQLTFSSLDLHPSDGVVRNRIQFHGCHVNGVLIATNYCCETIWIHQLSHELRLDMNAQSCVTIKTPLNYLKNYFFTIKQNTLKYIGILYKRK